MTKPAQTWDNTKPHCMVLRGDNVTFFDVHSSEHQIIWCNHGAWEAYVDFEEMCLRHSPDGNIISRFDMLVFQTSSEQAVARKQMHG